MRRALQNETTRASRTFVVTAAGRIVGYYALATGAVSDDVATDRVRRNMVSCGHLREARQGYTAARRRPTCRNQLINGFELA
jgi:hypothetical protein